MRVYWEMTSKCNGKCAYCFQHAQTARQTEEASYDRLQKVVSGLKAESIVITGGEPSCSQSMCSSLLKIKERLNVRDVRLLTGGSGDLDAVLWCAKRGLITGLSVTDHGPEFRQRLINLTRLASKSIPVSVVIPVHRGRLKGENFVISEYSRAGCVQISLNLVVFPERHALSLEAATASELESLMELADRAGGAAMSEFVRTQLRFMPGRKASHCACVAGQEFVFLGVGGRVSLCPHRRATRLDVPIAHDRGYGNASQGDDGCCKKECMVTAACVCINGYRNGWK